MLGTSCLRRQKPASVGGGLVGWWAAFVASRVFLSYDRGSASHAWAWPCHGFW